MTAPGMPGPPGITAPSTTAPSTTAPSTTAPSTTTPSTTAPSTTAPITDPPETTDPPPGASTGAAWIPTTVKVSGRIWVSQITRVSGPGASRKTSSPTRYQTEIRSPSPAG